MVVDASVGTYFIYKNVFFIGSLHLGARDDADVLMLPMEAPLLQLFLLLRPALL